MSIPVINWLQPGTPLFYWYAYFIFGPMFFYGWWGLGFMILIHIIVWMLLRKLCRKTVRAQSVFQKFIGTLGLLILTNLLSGVLVYVGIWILGRLDY